MKSKRYAQVDENRCVACGACMKECPKNAISIVKGCYAKIESIVCVGCGKCESFCPAGSIELKVRGMEDE